MAVDISRVAFATRDYRSVTRQDLTVQTRHPLAVEMTYATFLKNSYDAENFGDQILSLLKEDRYTWTLRVIRENYNFSVGDTITVVYPRYGLSNGGNFIVKRIRNDLNSPFLELSLFGPGSIAAPVTDTTPDAFSFPTKTNVALNTLTTSDPTNTISGINAPAPISVTGGSYSIDGGAFTTSPGTVTPGQTVRAQHTSSGSNSTDVVTTVTIGGVSAAFTSTTQAVAADTTPDAFSFATQNNVALNTPVTSAPATITGINSPAPISVTGGSYSIDGGTYTTSSGTVSANQQVRARHTSSGSNSAGTNTTVTIGGVSATFTSNTVAAANTNLAPGGGTFDSSDGWVTNGGWTISGGKAQASGAANSLAIGGAPLTVGKSYLFSFDYSCTFDNGGKLRISDGQNNVWISNPIAVGSGTMSGVFMATSTGFLLQADTAVFNGTVDNLVLTEAAPAEKVARLNQYDEGIHRNRYATVTDGGFRITMNTVVGENCASRIFPAISAPVYSELMVLGIATRLYFGITDATTYLGPTVYPNPGNGSDGPGLTVRYEPGGANVYVNGGYSSSINVAVNQGDIFGMGYDPATNTFRLQIKQGATTTFLGSWTLTSGIPGVPHAFAGVASESPPNRDSMSLNAGRTAFAMTPFSGHGGW